MTALPHQAWDGLLLSAKAQQGAREGDGATVRALKSRLFDRQLAAIESEADFQSRCGGRRGGKTLCNATDLETTAIEHPGNEMSLYITLTKHHSRRNLERQLDLDIARHSIPFKKSQTDGQLYLTHENGHVIWLTGCKDRGEADKLRGDKYRKVIIDEAGAERFAAQEKTQQRTAEPDEVRDLMQYLVMEVLDPALSDLNGQLVLSGSPAPLPRGFFWQVTTGDGKLPKWETHTWTVLDNPFHVYSPLHPKCNQTRLKRTAVRLGCKVFTQEEQDERTRSGTLPYPQLPWLEWASPAFQREWLAMWTSDTEALCYNYVVGRNSWDGVLPAGKWEYVLGVDIGFNDQATFVVTASRYGFPDVYFLEAYGRSEMLPDQIAAEILRINARYPIGLTVVDPGGGGKFQIEDIKSKHPISIRAAEKRAKGAAIRALNGGLRAGTVHIDSFKCRQLVAELLSITWDQDRANHDAACVDDTADAAVYAYREHPNWETWDKDPPPPGTPEAIDLEARQYKDRLAERMRILRDGSRTEKRRLLRGGRR